MRIMFREKVYGWVMTGLLGKDAKWFFGLSKAQNPTLMKGFEPVCELQPGDDWCIGPEGSVIVTNQSKPPQMYWPENVRKNYERNK